MPKSLSERVRPTKIELFGLRRSLDVAENVRGILEDKREILLRKIEELIEDVGDSRQELGEPLTEAFSAVSSAFMRLGVLRVESIAINTPESVDVTVNTHRVVDVEVPQVELSMGDSGISYGFLDTSPELDESTRKMRRALASLVEAAELESAIFRLASELKETQRLMSALENVVIPDYEDSIRYIESTLEEREREEFVRLKHIKEVLEAKHRAD